MKSVSGQCPSFFQSATINKDFNEKEITIEKVDLVSTHSTDPDVQALLNDKENNGKAKNSRIMDMKKDLNITKTL